MTKLTNSQKKAVIQLAQRGFLLGAPMHTTYVALEKKGIFTAPNDKGHRAFTEHGAKVAAELDK